jgi:signal transduction histidine kinase
MRSVLHRLSLRWRLALLSAGLTFVILCAFAAVIGQLTINRVRSDFRREVSSAVDSLQSRLTISYKYGTPEISEDVVQSFAASNRAVIRVVLTNGTPWTSTRDAPDFEQLGLPLGRSGTVDGYRVETRQTALVGGGFRYNAFVQYARSVDSVNATVGRVRLFLIFGVLAGTAGALVLALVLSKRALAPITRLTSTARDIGDTRDPSQRVPIPDTEDEVAELAHTMDDMLQALEQSRTEREALLIRQREFIADASHELRTPLTSVLANLELLTEVLDGERGEAARSALRSTQRMRRLVADLLLLARADSERRVPHAPTDLAQIVIDAAGELEPVAEGHELTVDAHPAWIDGARDELHRMALNLIQNAVHHTPPGTRIHVQVAAAGDVVRFVVSDDGPGVAEDLRPRIFDRFVRGEGDRGGSTGLGLAIVRAVAHTHGGEVELISPPEGGTRFEVTLPALPAETPKPEAQRPTSIVV